MEATSVWIQFLILTLVIGLAGYNLSRYGDVIAEKTGLGRNLVGLILLSTITSLPELVAGISSVTLAKDANLAVGDILGSCLFNLTLVFFLDLFYRDSIVYSRVRRTHLLTAALGVILIGFVGFAIMASRRVGGLSIGHVSLFSLAIPVVYFLAMRMLYNYERANQAVSVEIQEVVESNGSLSLRRATVYFSLAAMVVVISGMFLPFVAEKIVHVMGWNSAFVGTMFLALATSLPEIAVTLGALRLAAVDLAFSNVLGSNLFNVVILAVDDLFYLNGPIFSSIAAVHAVTAFAVVMMTGLVMVALIQPPQKRVLNLVTGLSLVLLGVYIFNAYIVFTMG